MGIIHIAHFERFQNNAFANQKIWQPLKSSALWHHLPLMI